MRQAVGCTCRTPWQHREACPCLTLWGGDVRWQMPYGEELPEPAG